MAAVSASEARANLYRLMDEEKVVKALGLWSHYE